MIFNGPFLLLVVAATVLGSPVIKRQGDELLPSHIYNYDAGSGAISCASSGVIKKHWNNNGHDITTLVTFSYPENLNGKTCQFRFKLAPGDVCLGSKKIDVFTNYAPTPGCPMPSRPPGNQRNINIGRMNAAAGTAGTWEAKYSGYLTDPTPCPHGVDAGMELVGVYDVDDVEWANPAIGGPRIYYR